MPCWALALPHVKNERLHYLPWIIVLRRRSEHEYERVFNVEVFSWINSCILIIVMVWTAEPGLSFPGGPEQKFLVFGTSQVRIIFSIINLNKSHRFLFLFFFLQRKK